MRPRLKTVKVESIQDTIYLNGLICDFESRK